MVEEFYYLNQGNGEMEKADGWKRQEFRLIRDGEIWCPRHNRFEFVWSEREKETITSRQCRITGFPIKYNEKLSFYGCRIIQHNEESPLQISFYVVIHKENNKKIKLIKREIRLNIDAVKGTVILNFPGMAALRLNAYDIAADPDGVYRDNNDLYENIKAIGYDMPVILQKRIIELLCDSVSKDYDERPEAKSCMSGLELIFSFVERPFDPDISRLKNFIGRHYDLMFPRIEKDNYYRMCTYIGLNDSAATLFRTAFLQNAYIVILLRLIFELGISDEEAITGLVELTARENYDRIFGIPYSYFQLFPAKQLKLSVAESAEYDFEQLFDDIRVYAHLIKLRYGDKTLARIIADHSEIGRNKEVWIAGDIISCFISNENILSRSLCEEILRGKLDIEIYVQLITELSNRNLIDMLPEPNVRWLKAEETIYSYKFYYVRTVSEIARIERRFDFMLEDKGNDTVHFVVFLNDNLECVITIEGKNVIQVYSSDGQMVTGRLRTACRTWAKKHKAYSDIIDRG